MTICIAALCDSGKTAILVADRRVGTDYIESDTGLKIRRLVPDWFALLAGNDLAAAHEIAYVASNTLTNTTGAVTAMNVRGALVNAYRSVRLEQAAAEHLASRGWTLDEFKEKGKASFPESTFAEIDGGIQRFDLEVDIIACGFSGPHGNVFTVSHPGKASFDTNLHFTAIGSGATAASISLFVRGYTKFLHLPAALLYVYEAKVAAQDASGVGQTSWYLITRQGQDPLMLRNDDLNVLESVRGELERREPSEDHLAQLAAVDMVEKLEAATQAKLPKPSTS